jgi:hypothetical protein
MHPPCVPLSSMQGLGLHGQVPVRLRLPHSPRVVQGLEDLLHLPPDQPAQAQVPVRDHPLQHLPSPWTLGAQSTRTVMLSEPPLFLFVETALMSVLRVYVHCMVMCVPLLVVRLPSGLGTRTTFPSFRAIPFCRARFGSAWLDSPLVSTFVLVYCLPPPPLHLAPLNTPNFP